VDRRKVPNLGQTHSDGRTRVPIARGRERVQSHPTARPGAASSIFSYRSSLANSLLIPPLSMRSRRPSSSSSETVRALDQWSGRRSHVATRYQYTIFWRFVWTNGLTEGGSFVLYTNWIDWGFSFCTAGILYGATQFRQGFLSYLCRSSPSL